MRKLLEAVTKFAGEPEQKPGDQLKGTDSAPAGKKLVGDSIIKDLARGPTPKTKEEELAEAYAKFLEDNLGVEPKRPSRKGSRPARDMGKTGEPSKRYNKVSEGWSQGTDRVSLPDKPDTYFQGTGQLQKEYEELYDKLVPSQGKADTVEGEVLRAASKIVYRHYNDGDEFNQASFDQLKPYIGHVTSYDDLAHKATMFAAAAEGEYHPNPNWDSLDSMEYGPADEDDDEDEDDDYEDWEDEDDEMSEGWGAETQARQHDEQMTATARVLQKYQDDPELSAVASYMFQSGWNAAAIDDTMQGRGKYDVDWWKAVMAKNPPAKNHTQMMIDKYLTSNEGIVAEGIESADPVEGAVLSAVQELIQQGHTEVAPEVITNMVVAATSQPFLLKDLVDANKKSPAIQHYVDSINPTKVKFSSDILTVKNEDPAKDKKASQAGVSSMAARAANRNRLGEGRAANLVKQYQELSERIRSYKESRGHKAVAHKLKDIEARKEPASDDDYAKHIERMKKSKEEYLKKNPKSIYKQEVDEMEATGQTTMASKTGTVDPQQAAQSAQATQALKSATGATAPAPAIAKALDAATQGTAVSATDMKAIEPMVDVLGQAAQDPKLANQFKTLADQARQS